MSGFRKCSVYALLIGAGYLIGTAQMSIGFAQPDDEVSESAADKVRAANEAVRTAMQALESEGAYSGIILSPTAFLVLSGGGDAHADLESGNGVDPETFAALYASLHTEGLIDPVVREALALDAEGRLTYNDEVVKLYSQQTLQMSFANRLRYSETEL